MKKIILLGATLLAAATSTLTAQSFTPAAGYTASLLFSTAPGISLGAFDIDAAGDLFYLGRGNDTRLFRRTLASGYLDESVLYDYGSDPFPAFVEVNGATVYFGESSTGAIRSVPAGGGISSLIATISGGYDLSFRGTDAFLSAASSFNNNRVFRLNLTTGALDAILDTGGDFSGPIEFDALGNLLYGATSNTFGGLMTGDIYRLAAGLVDGAIDADPQSFDLAFGLGAATVAVENGNNQSLAYRDENHLFQTDSPFGGVGAATRYDLVNQTAESVGETALGQFLSGAATDGSALYVAVSDGSASAVFRVVPEPSTAGLMLGGIVVVLGRRRRL